MGRVTMSPVLTPLLVYIKGKNVKTTATIDRFKLHALLEYRDKQDKIKKKYFHQNKERLWI